MRVRDWDDLVADVVESDADPEGWRAVAGDRRRGVGEDLYLAHPATGVFQLKTYAKNPFEVRGVGARVARSLDEEVGRHLPDETDALFGVHPAPEDGEEAERRARRVGEVVRAHAETPTTPADVFEDVMEAVGSPAFGPMEYDQYGRPDALEGLTDTFEGAEELLEAEFEDVVAADEVDRGFR